MVTLMVSLGCHFPSLIIKLVDLSSKSTPSFFWAFELSSSRILSKVCPTHPLFTFPFFLTVMWYFSAQ